MNKILKSRFRYSIFVYIVKRNNESYVKIIDQRTIINERKNELITPIQLVYVNVKNSMLNFLSNNIHHFNIPKY